MGVRCITKQKKIKTDFQIVPTELQIRIPQRGIQKVILMTGIVLLKTLFQKKEENQNGSTIQYSRQCNPKNL